MYERGLPQNGGLSSHVRAGDDEQSICRVVHVQVIWNERVLTDGLDHRMTTLHNLYLVAVVHDGSHVATAAGSLGERGQRVVSGEGGGCRLNALCLGGDFRTKPGEDFSLKRSDAAFRAEHFGFP